MKKSPFIIIMFSLLAAMSPAASTSATQSKLRENVPAVIWENPSEIRSRDLYYGSGSQALAPAAPFEFLGEDKQGISPKFTVKDARDVEWSVKLGHEAQAEVAAMRLVWAVGYFTEETYYFARVRINKLPRLSRGEEYVEKGGVVRGVRFESRRSEVERGEYWAWSKNPFVGTRQLDGLRVLMIMLNNFDVKTANNRVLIVSDPQQAQREARYVAADLGASLVRAGGLGAKRSKNNVEDFASSRFVLGVEDGMVDFDYHVRPTGFAWAMVAYPPVFLKQWANGKAMADVPVAHARWIGGHLARLTSAQLHDAFRAAEYDEAAKTAYVKALQERIEQLIQLPGAPNDLADVARAP